MRLSAHSHLKEMGFWKCLRSSVRVQRYWGGKIIHVGSALFYIGIDLRENWVKDMMFPGGHKHAKIADERGSK